MNTIQALFLQLENYCEKEEFKGWDPFDGLNSSLFTRLPFLIRSRFFKLGWIQFFKRFPINLRDFAGIRKEYNPKGLGLFLSGYCNLYKIDSDNKYLDKIRFFINKIIECQSIGYSGRCWGYNFDWQARAFFQPKGTPSVVATSFIGCAILDAYEITSDYELLKIARSACDFILKDLNRTYDAEGDFSFSYSPLDKTQVFNASLLGARLLSRTYFYTKELLLIEESRKAVSYACKHQQSNGAWTYSPLPFHSWIDNFHTGYNLECIYTYQFISGDNSFKKHLDKGLEYYLNTFFEKNGLPKYYNNSTYPIDIHAPAQLVITLVKLNKFTEHKELIDKVLKWTFNHMLSNDGYFYYQINKYFSSKIPYMRWAQAWMFYALSECVLQANAQQTTDEVSA